MVSPGEFLETSQAPTIVYKYSTELNLHVKLWLSVFDALFMPSQQALALGVWCIVYAKSALAAGTKCKFNR